MGLGECASVEWLGHRGMKWPALLLLLFKEKQGPSPRILVVLLGLLKGDPGLLTGEVKSDLVMT